MNYMRKKMFGALTSDRTGRLFSVMGIQNTFTGKTDGSFPHRSCRISSTVITFKQVWDISDSVVSVENFCTDYSVKFFMFKSLGMTVFYEQYNIANSKVVSLILILLLLMIIFLNFFKFSLVRLVLGRRDHRGLLFRATYYHL